MYIILLPIILIIKDVVLAKKFINNLKPFNILIGIILFALIEIIAVSIYYWLVPDALLISRIWGIVVIVSAVYFFYDLLYFLILFKIKSGKINWRIVLISLAINIIVIGIILLIARFVTSGSIYTD